MPRCGSAGTARACVVQSVTSRCPTSTRLPGPVCALPRVEQTSHVAMRRGSDGSVCSANFSATQLESDGWAGEAFLYALFDPRDHVLLDGAAHETAELLDARGARDVDLDQALADE